MDDEQKKFILENVQEKSVDEIAEALGVKKKMVRRFLVREEKKKILEAAPALASSSAGSSFKVNRWLLACLSFLVLGFLIYSNTFHASFHFDDNSSIVNNPGMLNAFDFGFLWKSYGLRILTYFTLALNYHFGKLDVFGYHCVNISIHILTSIAVFLFLYITTQTPWMRRKPLSLPAFWMAFGGGMLFLSHPLQTQAVTYIVQRAASLATLLYVSTMVCYIRWRLSKNLLFYGLAFLSGCLAMLSKEISATLPFALLLYEFCFFDREERKSSRVVLWIFPFFLLWLIFMTKFNVFHVPENVINVFPADSQNISRGTYLLTQFRVITTYVRLLFFPIHQTLDYYFPLSRTLADPATFLSALFLAGILFLAIALFKRFRLLSFGILWFFLTLSVESSIIPIRDVIFEHRLYLPMVGFCFVLSSMLCWWGKDVKTWGIILIVLVTALSFLTFRRNAVWQTDLTLWGDVIRKEPKSGIGYANVGLAYQKQDRYAEAIPYHLKAMELSGLTALTVNSLALAYRGAGQYDKAIEMFKKGISLCPGKCTDLYNNLGAVLDHIGRDDEAIGNYLHVIKTDPQFPNAYFNLGLIYARKGEFEKTKEQVRVLESLRQFKYAAMIINAAGSAYFEKKQYEKALEAFQKAIKIDPEGAPEYYNNLGSVLSALGRLDESIPNFLRAIRMAPSYPNPYFNLGVDYVSKGELGKAKEQLQILERLGQNDSVKTLTAYMESQKPESQAKRLNDLGNTYAGARQLEKAIEAYRKAIKIHPDGYPDFYNNLGVTLDDAGHPEEVVENYLHAIKINPRYPDAHFNLGMFYARKGEFKKAEEQVRELEKLKQTRFSETIASYIENQKKVTT